MAEMKFVSADAALLHTLDTYADVFNRMNFDAADKFDDLMEKLDLGAGKKGE